MAYVNGEWVQDPKPATMIVNGTADQMFGELEDFLGDFWDVACPDFDKITPFEAEQMIRKDATSMVVTFGYQCRHCGGWDGEVEFFNDAGDLVFRFGFSD